VVNIKETGQILLVDYSDIKNLKTTTIGPPSSCTTAAGTLQALLPGGGQRLEQDRRGRHQDRQAGRAGRHQAKIPHPGRGANFVHPKFGPVWATGHLGDDVVTLISTPSDNPKHAKYKQYNWKVVQELKAGAGNLFVKTHPKSKHLWADAAAEPRQGTGRVGVRVGHGRPVQAAGEAQRRQGFRPAADQGAASARAPGVLGDGKEVWISLWGGKTDQSAIVVYDDKTLKVKKVITDPKMITPTGKFNVYNTQHDIY
jgi:nitrite reductase (NO-forming)/hydroxylamine reductase